MSMPNFPEIDPEITCDRALNMILASIAMEELALSHIINAEGEKLQYVLGTLETNCGKNYGIDEILKVNQSVISLLDSVSQNQMLLKNKMDKALQALSDICPKPSCSVSPDQSRFHNKCSAVFKADKKCRLWHPGSEIPWNAENLHGICTYANVCDKTKIKLYSTGQFAISFAVNVRGEGCKNNASVSLRMEKNHQSKDIYTVRSYIPRNGEAITMTTGKIIIENSDPASFLTLKLESPDSLIIEDSMLSIMQI